RGWGGGGGWVWALVCGGEVVGTARVLWRSGMTRQGGRLALAVGLGAFLASGCTPSWAERCPGPDPLRAPAPGAKAAVVGPDDGGSSYNPQPRGHPQGERPRTHNTKGVPS